ncbi:MAG TPA: response regulator transcription factor [Actinocrinis sp.]|nr:response regulator transcription factor [Actinocrinis sp.]
MTNEPGQRVLLVDDEPAVREAIRGGLEFEGFQVAMAADGLEAMELIAKERPDVVLLDVMMPRMDGLTVLRRLRASDPALPVLLLTARDTVGDRVTGLDLGADDYLTKPFDLDELLARLRSLLRRGALVTQAAAGPDPAQEVLSYADLRMDMLTRDVARGERAIELTRTEFNLLEMFLRHPRQVLSREQLLSTIWGFDFGPSSNSLDVYIMYLRRKTEAGSERRLLHTVRGVGYVLRGEGAGSA